MRSCKEMVGKQYLSLTGQRSITQPGRLAQIALLVLLLLPLLALVNSVSGQPALTGSSANASAKPPSAKSDAASEKASATPAPSPEPKTIWTREALTGDWGGTRKSWE